MNNSSASKTVAFPGTCWEVRSLRRCQRQLPAREGCGAGRVPASACALRGNHARAPRHLRTGGAPSPSRAGTASASPSHPTSSISHNIRSLCNLKESKALPCPMCPCSVFLDSPSPQRGAGGLPRCAARLRCPPPGSVCWGGNKHEDLSKAEFCFRQQAADFERILSHQSTKSCSWLFG